MHTFKITFVHEKDDQGEPDTVELIASNKDEAAELFKISEPFLMILKIELI